MNKRDIITYLRLEETESLIVSKDNRAVTSNKYPIIFLTEKPMLRLRPLQADGTPYTLADFSDYVSFDFGIDDDWNRTTTPKIHAVTGIDTFTVAEVTVNDITYVEISVELNGNSAPLEALFNDTTTKRITDNVYAELSAFNAGSETPDLILQFPFVFGNKLLDLNSVSPDEPISNYYTIAQTQAILGEYLTETEINAIFTNYYTAAEVLTQIANGISTHNSTYNHDDIAGNKADIIALDANQSSIQTELSQTTQKASDNEDAINLLGDEMDDLQEEVNNINASAIADRIAVYGGEIAIYNNNVAIY